MATVTGADVADLRWTIGDVGAIKAKWNPHVTGNDLIGLGASPTATYTDLPANYNDFGLKTITAAITGPPSCNDTQKVEIFFPRDATNNPTPDPNWFFYWRQVRDNANMTYNAANPSGGSTLGITAWDYTIAPDKDAIEIGTQNPGSGREYGVGEQMSGIDKLINNIVHEECHVDQIVRADPLVPSNGADSFRYGWAWNQGTHNHWNEGADGKWGVAGVDDDGNGTKDDAKTTPAFEPGNGDDVTLDHATDPQWPAVWPLPNPDNAFHPIESECVNAGDAALNEDDNAASDWGDPGKQHETINMWND